MTTKRQHVIIACVFTFTSVVSLFAKDHQKLRNNIIRTAKKFVGTKYTYGGNKKTGFDCSGFVMFVFHKHNIQLPRTSLGQYTHGKKISAHKAKPGDLVFFKISGSKISHVGIFLGDTTFIHSPSSGKKITISDLHSAYWQERLAGFVRYLP